MNTTPRHFLDLTAVSASELRNILDAASAMKAKLKSNGLDSDRPLTNKTLAMIFEKPSTRTRVSFEVGMRQLGGEVVMLTGAEMQLGRGETIADTARVLSRFVDIIMIRILNHDSLMELANNATVPVINGLTRFSHPCQVMADVMTYEEHRGNIKGRTVAWVGDDNNVLMSWAHAAERFKFKLNIATPPQLSPKKAFKDWLAERDAQEDAGRKLGKPASKQLFPGPGVDGHLTRQHFYLLIKDIAVQGGVDPSTVTPHTLRHAFATHLLAGGADLMVIQALLGHADVATTEIYTHVLDEDLRRLVLTHHPLATGKPGQ